MARQKKPKLPGSTLESSTTTRFGDTLVAKRPRCWELGTIIDYTPAAQTYLVCTGSNPRLPDVPRLVQDPGETTILPRDTIVVIHHELGFPVIDKVLKQAPSQTDELRPTQVSEIRGIGGEDPLYAPDTNDTSFRSPNDPQDVLPEDWVRRSKDGNLMGVLRGGVNVMKSSPMAQIRTHSLEDLVEIISSKFRHITDMGNYTINNDGGKTSLTWYAGSDQSLENGANTEKWTIRLEVGAIGDLFTLRVTTPDGNDLAKIHMSANGRMELLGAAGIDITSGENGTMEEAVASDKTTKIDGDYTVTVRGNVAETFNKDRDTTVSKNATLLVGNSLSETVSGDHGILVNGVDEEKIGGGGPVPPPSSGTVAKLLQILNGSYVVDIGNPTKTALPGLGQAETHVNWVDGFYFALQPSSSGTFAVLGNTSGCVQLGANGAAIPSSGGYAVTAITPFNAMMYQPWEAFIKVLLQWLDAHQHGTAMGPSTPPVVPLTSLVRNLYPLVKSDRVTMGA